MSIAHIDKRLGNISGSASMNSPTSGPSTHIRTPSPPSPRLEQQVISKGVASIPDDPNWRARVPSRHYIPTVVMRAGTSKGLFLHLSDLPSNRALWTPIILSIMGSPDRYGRQLDGLGGGASTLSKVAVVSKSEVEGVDVDYLFIQGKYSERKGLIRFSTDRRGNS
jgi:hypothetical protein